MPIGAEYNRDCVFKKSDAGKTSCVYPKTVKVCYGCSCYLKHNDDLDRLSKYISFVATKKNAALAMFMSSLSLIISIITLLLKLSEMAK
jgi:hypothetical protein